MKKLLILITLLLALSFPVYASEVKGNLSGIVISAAEKQLKINQIQAQINMIIIKIAELQRLLRQLRK